MQFATEVSFNSPTDRHSTLPDSANDAVLAATPNFPQHEPGLPASHLGDLRICGNDISIGVSGGSFTKDPTNNQTGNDPANNQTRTVRAAQASDCQISSVASLTDDKLMELYVRKGVVSPPPPMGSGQIQVGAQTTPAPGGGAGGAGAPQGNSPQSAGPASRVNGVDRN